MTIVVVYYKSSFPVKHMFNDFQEAIAYASLTFDQQDVQSITIEYERV